MTSLQTSSPALPAHPSPVCCLHSVSSLQGGPFKVAFWILEPQALVGGGRKRGSGKEVGQLPALPSPLLGARHNLTAPDSAIFSGPRAVSSGTCSLHVPRSVPTRCHSPRGWGLGGSLPGPLCAQHTFPNGSIAHHSGKRVRALVPSPATSVCLRPPVGHLAPLRLSFPFVQVRR